MREPYMQELSERVSDGFMAPNVVPINRSVRSGGGRPRLVKAVSRKSAIVVLKGGIRLFFAWIAKQDNEAARIHENLRRAQDADFRKYYHHNREIR